jgi:hypothetical protein
MPTPRGSSAPPSIRFAVPSINAAATRIAVAVAATLTGVLTITSARLLSRAAAVATLATATPVTLERRRHRRRRRRLRRRRRCRHRHHRAPLSPTAIVDLTPKMLLLFGNFARPRRSRRSRCARQDGAIRWRQHVPRHRPGRAWLGLSVRSRAARACHLPASSRCSRSGTELAAAGRSQTRSCQ